MLLPRHFSSLRVPRIANPSHTSHTPPPPPLLVGSATKALWSSSTGASSCPCSAPAPGCPRGTCWTTSRRCAGRTRRSATRPRPTRSRASTRHQRPAAPPLLPLIPVLPVLPTVPLLLPWMRMRMRPRLRRRLQRRLRRKQRRPRRPRRARRWTRPSRPPWPRCPQTPTPAWWRACAWACGTTPPTPRCPWPRTPGRRTTAAGRRSFRPRRRRCVWKCCPGPLHMRCSWPLYTLLYRPRPHPLSHRAPSLDTRLRGCTWSAACAACPTTRTQAASSSPPSASCTRRARSSSRSSSSPRPRWRPQRRRWVGVCYKRRGWGRAALLCSACVEGAHSPVLPLALSLSPPPFRTGGRGGGTGGAGVRRGLVCRRRRRRRPRRRGRGRRIVLFFQRCRGQRGRGRWGRVPPKRHRGVPALQPAKLREAQGVLRLLLGGPASGGLLCAGGFHGQPGPATPPPEPEPAAAAEPGGGGEECVLHAAARAAVHGHGQGRPSAGGDGGHQGPLSLSPLSLTHFSPPPCISHVHPRSLPSLPPRSLSVCRCWIARARAARRRSTAWYRTASTPSSPTSPRGR